MGNNYMYTGKGLLDQITHCFNIPYETEAPETDLETTIKNKIKEITELIDKASQEGKVNEQWFTDAMDELNKQSLRY